MKWKLPPVIKLYEAIGAVGDGRVEITGDRGSVLSSNGDKRYEVAFDSSRNAITANDNGSHWRGYLGYPAIAFLMSKGIITCDKKWEAALRYFSWKELNVRFKNDYQRTQDYVRHELAGRGYDLEEFDAELEKIMKQIGELGLERLPSRLKPPEPNPFSS